MLLPVNLNLTDRLCVIIGGGPVALRKATRLSENGARVRVVAPAFVDSPEWKRLGAELITNEYREQYIKEAFLVIAATNDPQVNSQIADDARLRKILQQRTDDSSQSDFTLPATLRHGSFSVSFATDGIFAALSVLLRDRADAFYDPVFGALCHLVDNLRQDPCWEEISHRQRQDGLRRIAASEVIDLLRARQPEQARTLAHELLFEETADQREGGPVPSVPGQGKVYLVGAGPGDPGLITVRGARYLAMADVVLFDTIVNPEILHQHCPDAEWINVGKRKGHKSRSQEKIIEMLIGYSHQGQTVVRLKGGDPLIYGRGGEEARGLHSVGVPYEIVPGVSSISAVPAYAGIPVTDREYSTSMGIYTMHKKGSFEPEEDEWREMATGPDTLVLLMGVTIIDRVAEQLVKYGRPSQTPVAIILHGTLHNQRRIVGTLATIVEQMASVTIDGPGLIIVGRVVDAIETMDWFPTKHSAGHRSDPGA